MQLGVFGLGVSSEFLGFGWSFFARAPSARARPKAFGLQPKAFGLRPKASGLRPRASRAPRGAKQAWGTRARTRRTGRWTRKGTELGLVGAAVPDASGRSGRFFNNQLAGLSIQLV